MSFCFGEDCTHPSHNYFPLAKVETLSRTCDLELEYKTDGDGNLVVLKCNRLRRHRGSHRGRLEDEVIRWK